MTIFPPKTIKKVNYMTTKLDVIPTVISRELKKKENHVSFNGLSVKNIDMISNRKITNLSIPIHEPRHNSKMNFGIMFYDHVRFFRTFDGFYHTINFKKIRDNYTIKIGKTYYDITNVREFVFNSINNCYTLNLKYTSSPLFIPFTKSTFIVLYANKFDLSNKKSFFHDENNDNSDLNDTAIVNDDYYYDNDIVDEMFDETYPPITIAYPAYTRRKLSFAEKFDYEIPPIEKGERLLDCFDNDDNDDNDSISIIDEHLDELFRERKKKAVTSPKSYRSYEPIPRNLSIVLYDFEKNSEDYKTRAEFLRKFPNAGSKMNSDEFIGFGIPVYVSKINETNEDYEILDIKESDTIENLYIPNLNNEEGVFTCNNVKNQLSEPEYEPLFDEVDYSDLPIKIDGKQKNIKVELTEQEIYKLENNSIFDVETKETKPKPKWKTCKYPIPDIEDYKDDVFEEKMKKYSSAKEWLQKDKKSFNSTISYARYLCGCCGNIQYHLDKELETGIELTSEEKYFYKVPLFDKNKYEVGVRLTPTEEYIYSLDIFNENIYCDGGIKLYSLSNKKLNKISNLFHVETELYIISDKKFKKMTKKFKEFFNPTYEETELYTISNKKFKKMTKKFKKFFKHTYENTKISTINDKDWHKEYENTPKIKTLIEQIKENDIKPNESNDTFDSDIYVSNEKEKFVSFPLNIDHPYNSLPKNLKENLIFHSKFSDNVNEVDVFNIGNTPIAYQQFIMANWDELYSLIYRLDYKFNNVGIDTNENEKYGFIIHGNNKYPSQYLKPILNNKNDNGLIICKEVKINDRTYLFAPVTDKVTIAVMGYPMR